METDTVGKVMVTSFTVNILMLLYTTIVRILNRKKIPHAKDFGEQVVSKTNKVVKRWENQRISRIATELFVTICCLPFSFVILAKSPVLQNPLKFPESEDGSLVWILTAITTGKFAYKLAMDIFNEKITRANTPVLIIHLVSFSVLSTCLLCEENVIFALVSVIIDAKPCETVIRKCVMAVSAIFKFKNSNLELWTAVIDIFLILVLQLSIPLFAVTYACTRQSLLVLSPLSLLVFCVSVGFFGILPLWRVYEKMARLVSANRNPQEGRSNSKLYSQPPMRVEIPFSSQKLPLDFPITEIMVMKPAMYAEKVIKNFRSMRSSKLHKFSSTLNTISE